MKTLFKILLLLTVSFSSFGQGESRTTVYSINGRPIDEQQLGLINPQKIKKVEVIKSSNPAEVRIWTKKIRFLSYNDIKEKLNIRQGEPKVIIDNKEYRTDGLSIDKSVIKKMNINTNGDIEIRTINFNKSRDTKIILRGATAHNIVFMSAWGSVGVVVSGSLFTFITVDNLEQVGLNIPLRFIFKPSYSPHCINTNVVPHSLK